MDELLRATTAYKILEGDRRANKLSHAYMLHFQDTKNLRAALKTFALEFYGETQSSARGKRILNESYVDLKICPQDGKMLTVDAVSEVIADSALKPVEGAKKLYIICGFESASPLVQNKLLKSLEEPLEGIHYLLGAASLAPVLDVIKSRVKMLEIPPFTSARIFGALERMGRSELNSKAADSANGVLGVAQNMVTGGWFKAVADGAAEICSVTRVGDIGGVAAKYADTAYKQELLSEMQRLYFLALTKGEGAARHLNKPALLYALERVNSANADLKFNANFHALLYTLMLGIAEENTRWHRLLQ